MSTDTVTVPCPACGTHNRLPAGRATERPDCGRCGRPLIAGKPAELTDRNFERQIEGGLPIVVDFWAPWCGPCRAMAPVFEKVAGDLAGRVRFGKVNSDTEPDIAGQYGIRSIPTLVVFRDGREVARRAGAMDAGALRRWLESV